MTALFSSFSLALLLIINHPAHCTAAVRQSEDSCEAANETELIATERCRVEFPGKPELHEAVHHISLSRDGQLLAVGGKGAAIVYSAKTGKQIAKLDCGKDNRASPQAFSADGNRLLVGVYYSAFNRQIKVWDIESGREVFSVKAFGGVMAFLPSEKQFVCNFNQTITIRDAKTGAVARRFEKTGPLYVTADPRFVTESLPDSTIKVWEVETGKEVANLKLPEGARALTRSGKMFWNLSQNEKIAEFWDVKTKQKIQTIRFPHKPVRSVLSPDERWLAVGLSSNDFKDTSISIYEVATGKELLKLKRPQGQPFTLMFDATGTVLIGSSDRIVQVWDLAERKTPPEK
ncbi:MAG: PQQ-binding-like beta-propeller repeat protein [Planctomycetes bacterium]|nr:PQQ-binding-like beta-propeller repeat protein [Planctomycetota bacterium]